MGCGTALAKIFLFVFNVVFWVVGAALLGVGIWVLVDPNAIDLLKIATLDGSDALVQAGSIILIVVGAIVFITGFLGCCGAVKESPCMLTTYAGIIIFILVLQVAAGICAAVFKDEIVGELEGSMNKTVQERYGNPNGEWNDTTAAWDIMQRQFKCCGSAAGPSEWETSVWWDTKPADEIVPVTCCVLTNGDDIKDEPKAKDKKKCNEYKSLPDADRSKFVYMKGCSDSLETWITDHAAILIGVAFGLAGFEIIMVIIACCLTSAIKQHYEYV